MVYRFLILFSILNYSAAQSVTLKCISDGDDYPAFIEFDNERRLQMVDLSFLVPSYIDPVYACAGFVERMNKTHVNSRSVSVLLGKESSWKFGRFNNNLQKEIYRSCIDNLSCKVNWPYILSTPGLAIDWFRKRYDKNENSCFANSIVASKPKQKLSSYPFLDTEKTTWWTMPETDIVKETLKVVSTNSYKNILISGMTASLSELRKLAEILKGQDTIVDVWLDLQLMTIKSSFINEMKRLSPKIRFHLVPRSPERPYSFHFKGVLFTGGRNQAVKDKLLWISPNWFPAQKELLFHDIGFSTTDNKFIASYKNQLEKYKQLICLKETKWTSCMLDYRLITQKKRKQLNNMKTLSCQSAVLPQSLPHDLGAVLFDKLEMRGALFEWMSSAKSEIEIHTHILKDSGLLLKLADLVKKGIKINLAVGSPIPLDLERKLKRYGINLKSNKRLNTETHSKFYIKDKNEAFITSANFTATGLDNPTESGFFTKDKNAIKIMFGLID